MSFDTILIANRGEIACRIIRTARAMGYRTVAVFTAPDSGAPHVVAADLAVPLDGVAGYLDGAAIIAAARRTGARAVHPGYGFLAENAGFARACAEAGLIFIGPSPEAIALMGSKAEAKIAAEAAGVPCLPGYSGADQSEAALLAAGARLGFPLMVKAAAGGGGKGMRLAESADTLPEALHRARSEAEKAFGNGDLILERALSAPRHIEVQVFGDRLGNVIHLGERDCSVQRRHQKIIEEAPAPGIGAELRERLGAAAAAVARGCHYVGAGTVEFLLEPSGAFHFLEMNTRLQVEHPVTEAVTGLDLVEWQIRIARGEALPLAQDQIRLDGHAIEARLYAEDPAQGFLPQTGRVLRWRPAPGLRVDHALAEGQVVGGDFDPMLAKLIAHGPDRDTARRRLIAGLEATELLGLRDNRAFLINLLRHEGFAHGGVGTDFLETGFADDPSLSPAPPAPEVPMLGAFLIACSGHLPGPRFGWTNGPRATVPFVLDIDGAALRVALRLGPGARVQAPGGAVPGGAALDILSLDGGLCRYRQDGVDRALPFAFDAGALHLPGHVLRDITHAPPAAPERAGDGLVRAPMAGAVVSVAVAAGERVERGQVLAVIEAMKLEHPLRAGLAGRVSAVGIAPGMQVRARQLMIEIEGEEGPE